VQTPAIEAVASEQFGALRDELVIIAREVWIPPATLVVAAALIQIIVEGRAGPWELDEALWGQILPERLPTGRSEWRNANYALQAAGCLAGASGSTSAGRSPSGSSRCGHTPSTWSSSSVVSPSKRLQYSASRSCDHVAVALEWRWSGNTTLVMQV
jgi:hypothetical protein